jgi:AraC-like DNA-binding protein
VEPLALLTALEGKLVARSSGHAFHLRSGELLVLRHGEPLEIDAAGAHVRLALFRASPEWVDAFCALHGTAPQREEPAAEWLPAGAALARRAAPLLAAGAPAGSESGAQPPATTVAALLEIAFLAKGSVLGSRRSKRQQLEQRETLLRGLAQPGSDEGVGSLDRLAERLDLSPRHTARLVRSETGRSFRELKAAARLERARELLATSDLSILEVALRAGWNSASQFHDAFRRHVGVTPARYRAAHRG